MISYTEFHSTLRFPTWESYVIRKVWKKARHLTKMSDAEILSRIGYEEGEPCLNCLDYGFEDGYGYTNGEGLCANHMNEPRESLPWLPVT